MLKRILISAGSLGIVCLLVFLGLAWRPAIAPVDPPGQSNFPDDLIDKAVNVVVAAAKTGKIGDGKVFVLPVEHAVRIRTEEIGEKAV